MNLFIAALFVLASTLFLLTTPADAGQVTLGSWQAQGSAVWRIAFPLGDNGTSAFGASELYYPQQGSFLTARYETPQKQTGYFSVEGAYQPKIRSQTGTDIDWNYNQGQQPWYYGQFQTDGASGYLTVNWHKPTGAGREIFYGYTYQNSNFQMTDGLYTIYDYQPVNTPLPALQSSYNLSYQGPHIGTAVVKKISPAISLTGSVSYSPLAAVRGHGWWNLRDLDFVHTGLGQMVDTQVGIRYTLPKTTGSITVGYRYQYLDIYKGEENTSASITWEKAATVQHGIYMSGQYYF